MSARRNGEGDWQVTGPGVEPARRSPSQGAGISLALTLATRHDGDCTFYVRDAEGTALNHVVKTGRGIVVHTVRS